MQGVLSKGLFSDLFAPLVLLPAQMTDPHRLSQNQGRLEQAAGPWQGWLRKGRTKPTGCAGLDGEMFTALSESEGLN